MFKGCLKRGFKGGLNPPVKPLLFKFLVLKSLWDLLGVTLDRRLLLLLRAVGEEVRLCHGAFELLDGGTHAGSVLVPGHALHEKGSRTCLA